MALVNILHMNTGDGESSYAKNSLLQETGIRNAVPFLKPSIKSIASDNVFKDCIIVADLGCSSGPNPLLVASNIITIVHEVCQENNRKTPQFQVFLNDLYGNDFNTIFKLLPDFYGKLKKDKGESFGPCFVSVVPGSFYDRLFPDQSLHLVHSSTSNHWLSKMPQGLENNGSNVYMAKTSPSNVYQAYEKQFHTDFTKFLQMRSEEVVHGGCMILTFPGRRIVDPTSEDGSALFELLGQSLVDILKEGLVRGSDINSFNLPFYFPCEDEVTNIIKNEGSFSLENMNVFKLNWDPHDTDYANTKDSDELSKIHGKNTSNVLRVALEPLLVSHFGSSIIDVLFKKIEKHVAEYLAKKKTRYSFLTISLRRK
ncbi:S-adenosyl-L-methionine:benzoic acid/salicylic acid carboxyl methyltransferase 3-like [Bidens hawaiensis]|uniref:S-adenosyl-L-methionine:benzoic acid/salicylic acid carboxyl methyltransferase 3-like n=1 Tax=Bidens hawaiensis TaxID=980011 RepID=UPI00404AF383